MPTQIQFTCPIDDLAMASATVSLRDQRPDEDTHHVHLYVSRTMICPNGHRWKVEPEDDITLERL